MAENQNINVNSSKVGMNQDSHPSELLPQEYILMVNGDIQSADGSFTKLTNEPSNILCSQFIQGYNVIGTLPIPIKNITIFFLVNPITNQSEIGYIPNINYEDSSDVEVQCENCNSPLIEGTPLEQITQLPLCNYITIINAPCLNFNINFPIRSQFSIGYNPNNNLPDNDALVLYFTDDYNPQRWLNINNIPYVIGAIDEANCNTPIYTNELDCSKILVNEPFTPPCISLLEQVVGGSLKGGMYQFTASYANNIGIELTDYFLISNGVAIYDVSDTITTNTDYTTNQAIKINISNLDSTLYNYINIAVLITVNSTTSIFKVGTFFINSSTLTYTFTGNEYDSEERLSIDDILRRRPLYTKAKGVTKANEFLFWYGLEAQREINLQPFVSKLRPKWQCVEVDEGWYANGINVANYTGYCRDEVYPFSIYFKFKGGYTTADFPLVNNDSEYYSQNYKLIDTVDNTINPNTPLDVYAPITDGNNITIPTCPTQSINQLWQVYNTAQDQRQNPLCPYSATGVETTYVYKYFTCNSGNYTDNPVNPSGTISPSNPYYYSQQDGAGNIIPNTQIYTTDGIKFYNVISGTEFSSCQCTTLPPNFNPVATSYTFNTLQEAQVNATVNTYTQTSCTSTPSYNPSLNGDPFGAGTSNPSGQITNSNAFIPQNISCTSATQIASSTTGSCLLNPNTNQPNTYAYLARITSPTQLYNPSGCSTCKSCNGYSSCYTDNQVWYSFVASSTTHAIKIGFNDSNPSVKISLEVYENCLGGCPIACTTPQNSSCGLYLLVGDVANGQIALTIGQTYYFRLFSPDPTLMANNSFGDPTDTKWAFATVCITTPTSIGTTTVNIPGEYQFQCTYKSNIAEPTQVLPTSGCEIQTYHRGDFAYWESTETYPNNPDVWGELCGKPIRHFKFPDERVIARYNTIYQPNDRTEVSLANKYSFNNKIYPIGLSLDVTDIKNILNEATLAGLISEEDRLNIIGWGIKRGNRRNNKSIIAKGLLYDLWESDALNTQGQPILDSSGTQSYEKIYYPSYSYNDLNNDPFLLIQNNGSNITHPYAGANQYKNGRYTFHSPDTSFNKPFLGDIIKLESVDFGVCRGEYSEVLKHAPYILLTKKAYELAEALAGLEVTLDAFTAASMSPPLAVLGTTIPYATFFVTFAVELAIGVAVNQGKYTTQWADLFMNMGTPKNPAIYYTSVGKYNSTIPIENGPYKKISYLTNSLYLNPGNIQINDNYTSVRINNFERESSVFLSLNSYDVNGLLTPNEAFNCIDYVINGGSLPAQLTGDNSKIIPYQNVTSHNPTQLQAGIYSNVGSYYASLKNYVPDQYGTIDEIEWLDTGYCGTIDWENNGQDNSCDTIFGGDTFINRIGLKRKFPFFIQDRVLDQPETPVQYSILNNVGYSKYYMDSFPTDPTPAQSFFGFTPPTFSSLVNEDSFFYKRGYFPLFSYGIPYFIAESDYNVDMRHGENYNEQNFYPYVGDVVDWTQQYKTPISFDNYFQYNIDYSKQNKENPYYILRNDYSNSLSYIQNQFPNRAIYSGEKVQNWLNYSANDYYDFPLEDGELIALNGVEQDKVVCRQTNSTKVFNAFITIQSSLETQQVSVGNMFATKPLEYYKSDLGFGGSTHYAFESTAFGHFYVNTENPSIFQLGGNQLVDITRGKEKQKMKSWFREHLPFNILKDFPTINIDNAYNNIGITTTWDNKLDRYFITKKDYKLLPQYKGLVSYTNNQFYYNSEIIQLTNTKFFCDDSWTIAYSPIIGEWISFYDFKPNYYVSLNTYFQSGVNPVQDITKAGVWNHLQTNKSYQVYYGQLYPWVIEYVTQDKLTTNTLEFIEYQCDVLRYQDSLNFYYLNNKTIDGALVYNRNQSTGPLSLVVAEKDNMYQLLQYPALNGYNTEILVTNVENNWRFNSLVDVSISNGNPIMINTCGAPYKQVNTKALDYSIQFLTKQLRNDYFIVRLSNNNDSQHKYILKYNLNTQTQSKT